MSPLNPHLPLAKKSLTYRQRELLALLQAAGLEWTLETKCARVTLRFEEAFDRLRTTGIPISAAYSGQRARLYRIASKPWPSPPTAPSAAKSILQPIRPNLRPFPDVQTAEARKARMARRQRQTQRDDLLLLLKSREPEWVLLPEVMTAGGAQYGARIFELRGLGYRIENKQEDGRSYFRLVTNPAPAKVSESPPIQKSSIEDDLLFPDPGPAERLYRDPEEG